MKRRLQISLDLMFKEFFNILVLPYTFWKRRIFCAIHKHLFLLNIVSSYLESIFFAVIRTNAYILMIISFNSIFLHREPFHVLNTLLRILMVQTTVFFKIIILSLTLNLSTILNYPHPNRLISALPDRSLVFLIL
jgi:hypothetical protein